MQDTNHKIHNSIDSGNKIIQDICSQSPFLLINTPCGVGKYKFNKVGYNNKKELILEYKIINDDHYSDTSIIKHYIGKYYYLSAMQVLYASNYVANS